MLDPSAPDELATAEPMPGPGRLTRRDRVGIAVSGLVVGLGAVVLAGSGIFDPGPAGRLTVTASPTEVAGIATGVTRWPVGQRRAAPVLRGRTLDGTRLTTAVYRGEVVVLNAWGSWCPPCRAEAPDLRRAALATRPLGVRFLGIDTRDVDAAARAFVRRYRIPYPSLVDNDGRLLLRLRDTIPPQAIPSTVILDRQGRVAARVLGRVRYPLLRALIADVLAEPGGTAAAARPR